VDTAATGSSKKLARVLGLGDLIAIVLGAVIGSGIFIVPGVVLRQVGGHLDLALAVWVVGGILSLLGALTFGELGAMAPEAGGLYVYIRDAFGPLPAFLYGWTQFFVIASGSVATLGVAAAAYLGKLVPLSPTMTRVVPVALIATCMAINVWGTSKSARVQAWSTFAKVSAIVVMAVALLLAGRVHGAGAPPPSVTPVSGGALIAGAGLALVATLWAYEGWQYVTCSAGEARDPQRIFPLGIVIGTAGVVTLYLLANVAYVSALGPVAVAHSDRVAADAVTAAFGSTAGVAMVVVVEIAVCSALNSVILTSPRVFYAMARDGLFFKRLADVHARFGTPAFAIVAGALWAMVLAVSGTYVQLLTYVIGTGWAFYGLGALTIFWYRRYRPDAVRPFRVPGYPVTPALFVLAALVVVIDVIITQPAEAAKGLGIALLGAPAYFLWRKRKGQGLDDTSLPPSSRVPSVVGLGAGPAPVGTVRPPDRVG
jgi:APA family basic amino acid/polyamine antiporter